MKLSYDHQRFDCLSPKNIDAAVKLMDTFYASNFIEYRKRVFGRLALEDILIRYRRQDERAPFDMVFKRTRRAITVTLRVRSQSLNVLDERASTEDTTHSLVPQPTWEYKRKKNVITFSVAVQTTLNMQTLKKLMRYMDSEKGAFRQGVAMRFLNMLALIVEPWLTAKLIEGLSNGDVNMILTYAVLFFVAEAGSSLFTYFGTSYLERAYHAMITALRFDLAENISRIKMEHIDDNGTGVFSERIISEAYNVANGINNLVLVLTDLFCLISLLIAFATISVPVMVYELLLYLICYTIVRVQSKRQVEDSRLVSAASETFSGLVSESVRASRDIRLLHCEESFLVKARGVIGDLSEKSLARRARVNTHNLARSQFVAWSDLIFMGILALLMGQHGMPPAAALALYTYNGRLFDIANRIAGANDAYYALLLSAERIYQLIDSDDFAKEAFGTKSLEGVGGSIELKGVSFSYLQKDQDPVPVLKGMDLRIRAGQSVALVGRNGCGKSTVLSLIAQLYEPERGTIALDGVSTAELDRDTVRNSIGVVSQSPYLFNMSIRDNFALVKSDVTDAQMVEVCTLACVHDDIMGLTNGYDTVVGEGGCMLSGGQRQRIALARAFLKDYPVIMLDEATSALDNNTQASICEVIKDMRGKKTVIMIAHRLSIIRDFDQIAYLQDGKVLAAGTHDELMADCPEYRKLYAEDCGTGLGT